MAPNNREVRARIAINWLENAGCLDGLLNGKKLVTNDHAHIGQSRGRSIVVRARDAANEILTQYGGGLSRVSAAEIDFNSGRVSIKPEYKEEFRRAVENYRSK